MVYYQYGKSRETAFDGEGQITSAIRYVTSDTAAAVYTPDRTRGGNRPLVSRP